MSGKSKMRKLMYTPRARRDKMKPMVRDPINKLIGFPPGK
jgi:hypothetical protein